MKLVPRLRGNSLFHLILFLYVNTMSICTALSKFRSEMLRPKWDLIRCIGNVIGLETKVIRQCQRSG
jgi:hypothetical protein